MFVFFQYIKNYFKSEFQWAPHVVIGAFLVVCSILNYTYDIYDSWLGELYESPASILFLFIFFSIAFVFSVSVVSLFKRDDKPIFNKKYLLFGFVGILFLSTDCSYYLMQFTEDLYSHSFSVRNWQHACYSNLASFITIIVPLYVLYFCVKYFKPELYGLKLNGARIKPYFWLILFMLPLIYLASFQPDFLETYPSYTDHYEYKILQTDQWVTAGAFELCYGFDFLSVELFFRGFMVIALSRFVGKDAILPMVTLYCFLHFGKPAGEAISSIFGGYILGILAYSSRNIYGGLIAHLGVAWGMEYMAWLQS